MLSLTSPQVGAASRPVWSAAGLDPIPSCVAANNYSGSSNNNICSRTGVAILNPLFKSNLSMIKIMRQKRNCEKCTVGGP